MKFLKIFCMCAFLAVLWAPIGAFIIYFSPNLSYNPHIPRSFLHSPVAVDDGRVYFFQPGYSLTVLDLETGTTFLRGEPLKPGADQQPEDMEIIGNVIKTEECIVDKRTGGKICDIRWSSLGSEIHLGRNFLVANVEGKYHIVNTDTGEMRSLPISHIAGGFLAHANRLYFIEEHESGQPQTLCCIDPASAKILWRGRGLERRCGRLRIVDEALYALPVNYLREADHVAFTAYSLSGEPLPDLYPDQPLYWEVRKAYIEPTIARDAKNTLQNRFGEKDIRNADILPDRAAAGISMALATRNEAAKWPATTPLKVPEHTILLFDDGVNHWRRRINCMDYNYLIHDAYKRDRYSRRPSICTFSGDGERLVYSTNTGKVECVLRATGRSAWIYSYSRYNGDIWKDASSTFLPRFSIARVRGESLLASPDPKAILNSFFMGIRAGKNDRRLFYDEEKATRDFDLDPQWMLGVSEEGDAGLTRPPAILDPNPPLFDYPEERLAALLEKALPFAILLLAVFVALMGRIRVRWQVLVLCLSMLPHIWILFAYGHYSSWVYRLTLLALHGTYIVLTILAVRRIGPWLDRLPES